MTTTQSSREVIAGVDTHRRTHHAAVIDAATGKLLGDNEFPATSVGYRQLLKWLTYHGTVVKVGVEGTGSYGAGLYRYLHAQDFVVIEVSRPNRQDRRARGKSDPIDAINAARAVLAEIAVTIPKYRDGHVETIRLIQTTRRSAVKARRGAIGQLHGVIAGGPEKLRTKLTGYDRAALVSRCARIRIPAGEASCPIVTSYRMLRRLAKRIEALDAEIRTADDELRELTQNHAPNLMAAVGVGPSAAGQLLTTVGENADRITSEASLARICGVAPVPASSGNTTRHRLHRGGDRQANSVIHMIVINRLRWHEPTKVYAARRSTEGKTKKEIIRCLKRAVIRELYQAIRTDFALQSRVD